MGDRSTGTSATLVAIGDVHGQWGPGDDAFLRSARPTLAMFVGDLGDEDVPIVERIARLGVPKAVMLGNHDAWRSFSNKEITSALHGSLDALGRDHLAYDVREVPAAGVSIVGARPFSWGGPTLRSSEVYDELYNVDTMQASANEIVNAARRAQHRDLIVLAHNGPTGLGSDPTDIYGKDFGKPGGDWGDEDLELALDEIRARGLRVRAVVAGHMHHKLLHPRGAARTRFVRRAGTLFVNCAVVPRVERDQDGNERSHFVRMQWSGGECQSLEEVWVDGSGREVRCAAPDVVDLAAPSAPSTDR